MVGNEEVVLPRIGLLSFGEGLREDRLRRGCGNIGKDLADVDEIDMDLLSNETVPGTLSVAAWADWAASG
jgi:hypothetical protein